MGKKSRPGSLIRGPTSACQNPTIGPLFCILPDELSRAKYRVLFLIGNGTPHLDQIEVTGINVRSTNENNSIQAWLNLIQAAYQQNYLSSLTTMATGSSVRQQDLCW
ncbi:hypothetical protein ACJ73_00746 [Blastomyces percursus]|uniref:Uncharacterized protein n=1 Tax=Blastomyces percursus TaxID=1658174 RepID=A0A1J9QHA2_9EURO|nr:hypothetical protein ACJ73_00746 [Blastomyces percursus]